MHPLGIWLQKNNHIQFLDDRRAGLQAGQQRAGAGNCAPGHGGGPGHHGRAGGRARKQLAALQSSLTTGLSNKADQSAFDVLEGVVATKSTLDGVGLKLSNYSTTAAMNGSIASANNATLATVAANYGLKTVVDQHSLDIAARITPLEVDTKVANALLGAVTAAALASELASRDASISGLQASKADASALTAYALQSAVDTSSEVDSKIAAALLNAVTMAALDAALLGKADASAGLPALHDGRTSTGGRHQNSKCPAGSRHRGLRRSADC